MKKVLLVIDCQEEFADENNINFKRILDYINTNRNEYDYVYATKFVQGNTSFKKYLGWELEESSKGLSFSADMIILKHGYGLDDYDVLNKDYHYDVVGCETDACVLKIAMDLFDREYDFAVLKDYTYSNSYLQSSALDIMKRNVGCLK